MKINILTLSWDGLHLLKKLKPGLEKNLSNFNYKWFIRDNGSKDGTGPEVKNWDNVELLEAGHNRASFSEGVNSLFDLAEPKDDDLILFLNNDIEFKEDQAINKMVDLMEKTKAAVVGCRLMFPGANKISHCGVILSPTHNSLPWHLKTHQPCSKAETQDRYFQAVTAACMLTTGKAFRKAGKLDTNLRWSFEDISYCLTLSIDHKEKVAYCGSTEIEHGTSVSLNKNPVHKLNVKNNVSYFKKLWDNKVLIDEDLYLKDPNYNIIK